MIHLVLAPFVFGYNIACWIRNRKRKHKLRNPKIIEPDGSPSPVKMIPVAAGAVSIISAIAALLAGATLLAVALPFLVVIGAAVVLAFLAKALGIGYPTRRK